MRHCQTWDVSPYVETVVCPCRACIKGQPDDEAVLCTSSATYALKHVETTNTLLLVPPTTQKARHQPCIISICPAYRRVLVPVLALLSQCCHKRPVHAVSRPLARRNHQPRPVVDTGLSQGLRNGDLRLPSVPRLTLFYAGTVSTLLFSVTISFSCEVWLPGSASAAPAR